jgi:hypothetical protein
MYRVKIKTEDNGIFSTCLKFLKGGLSENDLKTVCILYGARHSGPNGPRLLKQVITEANNRCLSLGANFILMVFPPELSHSEEKVSLEPEDIIPERSKLSVDCQFSLLGKPIFAHLPKLKAKNIFIDPRW